MTDNPILNNPYVEPEYHYDVDAEGNLDYTKVMNGRRPFMAQIQLCPTVKAIKTSSAQKNLNHWTIMRILLTDCEP